MKYRILKENEYEKYKYMLPNPGRRFWIESERELGPKKCGFVTDEGAVDKNGTFCSDTTLYLRPVIEYEPDEKKDVVFSEGQQVKLHGLEWTAVSDNVLVCDRCIEEVKFDDQSTEFENSYLKYALHQYFRKRSSSEALTTSAKAKEMVAEEKEALDGDFSSGVMVNFFGMLAAVITGIICIFTSWSTSASVFSIIEMLLAIFLGTYNIRKVTEYFKKKKGKKKIALDLVTEPEQPAMVEDKDLKLSTSGITDQVVCEKTEEINKLLDAILKTGNRTAQSKVKFFYLPETQKTLELYEKLWENGIDTPNSKECLDIISENLDKTIRLLRIEYDKATSDDLLDARLQSGVIGKMLDDAENAGKSELKMEQ